MDKELFKQFDHLGAFYPYFFTDGKTFKHFAPSLEEICRTTTEREIDVVGVNELLNKKFLLGNRTLIKNIQRSPWMAEPSGSGNWKFANVPPHLRNIEPATVIAEKLFALLCDEITAYVRGYDEVGIFLSGGMDSRMVAGVLDYLIKSGRINKLAVRAVTWGNDNTRDVVYAKEIAARLNWEWRHYRVTADNMIDNIYVTAREGCEYSPVHLHAIPQIGRDNKDLKCFLAGSYGDSVGRAEYSGLNVVNLKSMDDDFRNFASLLKTGPYSQSSKDWKTDLEYYYSLFPQPEQYHQNELDYQLHYMRRMLNPCFEALGTTAQFYQAFTSPSVFSYMWSLDPGCRTDDVYFHMFPLFSTELSDIPWARTGLKYGQKQGVPDKFLKQHHRYTEMLGKNLLPVLRKMALSESIRDCGIFNIRSIQKLVSLVEKFPGHNFDYLERLLWLAAFSEMIKHYGLTAAPSNATLLDVVQSEITLPAAYIGKHQYRKWLQRK